VIPVETGGAEYMAWLRDELKPEASAHAAEADRI